VTEGIIAVLNVSWALHVFIKRQFFLHLFCLDTRVEDGSAASTGCLVGWLEFNVPFQHKYGYIGDDIQLSIGKVTPARLRKYSNFDGLGRVESIMN